MNFILGAGITGLTAALYHKEYSVLGKDSGQKQIGPRILKRTEAVDSFLEKFEINLKPVTYKCGYITDEKINFNTEIHTTIDSVQKNKYLKKTNRAKIENTMNDGITEMQGYDMTELYEVMFKKVMNRIVFLEILKIDTKKKTIIGKQKNYHYNKVINTFPVSIFNSLLGYSPATIQGTIYAYIFKSRFFDKFLSDFDFLYFTRSNIPFYRITKHPGNIFSAESMHPFTKYLGDWETLDYIEMPSGKITKNTKPLKAENIFHLGRYATNNQGMRLHTVIKILENKNEK